MNYELRHFNTPLLRFHATEDSSTPEITILWCDENQKNLLPLDLQLSSDGISKWLKHRTIPKNRAYVHNFLSKCGLHTNRPMNIIRASKGLSLNDCYWIVEEGFEGTFEKYNLYDNRFSKVLALIAFTGYGSSIRTSLASCPEFTTNGMLPKCWRRQDGVIKLYKGGTSGASNNGMEPYSEYYKTLGPEFVKALHDMFVFDALVCNTDRHFGNFGFLVDNHTNKIAAPAPLFDHGNSLFNYAGMEDFESMSALQQYAETLLPCVYDDFIGTAKKVLTEEHRKGLRRLLDFKFKRHPRYNLPKERLTLIEKQIQKRAQELLD